jgi:hypothetical protein
MYLAKVERAFRHLCETARTRNELHFALALGPEFRGEQGPGWCTWEETNRAFNEYLEFINQKAVPSFSFRIRVALAFYCHLAEASGFYEGLKNLLRIAGGEEYSMCPFLQLNRRHSETGSLIAPNANKVFRDLIGHAESLEMKELSAVLREAFDPDIRNGYAHADYIIWRDGLRLRRHAGGLPKTVSWEEFDQKMMWGMNFYHILRQVMEEYIQSYSPAKEVTGSMGDALRLTWRIEYNPTTGDFLISGSGPGGT